MTTADTMSMMSTAEILAELKKLKPEEREEILHRLCELQEAELLQDTDPTRREKQILDQALAAFLRDGNAGRPWRDVLCDLGSTG